MRSRAGLSTCSGCGRRLSELQMSGGLCLECETEIADEADEDDEIELEEEA